MRVAIVIIGLSAASHTGHADNEKTSATTHPVWKDIIERVSLDVGSELRPRESVAKEVSTHKYNAAFPAQVFENVCLEFTSEGASHYLRGNSPFWVPQRGGTRLVVLKGGRDIPKGSSKAFLNSVTAARAGGGGGGAPPSPGTKVKSSSSSSSPPSWPVPSLLPQVFSAAVDSGADVTADNGTWVSIDWDVIPPHA